MNTDLAVREKTFRMLKTNPEVRGILARALDLEDQGRSSNQYYLGWEWSDIPSPPHKLRILVEEQLVKIAYHSRSSKTYLLENPELVREAMAAIGVEEEEGEIPPNLFDHIVGHEEVKYWLRKSLAAPEPVHILMVGPPATAKSLFLEALGSLPAAQYALGGASSRAGIADFLINFRPRYLIIDELDKMKGEDYSVLLSVMQSGVVARMKKGLRDVSRMQTWVYAGVNRADRLPPELLSRFLRFDFPAYTAAEFIEVAVAVITQQLGKEEALARYIAERVSQRTRDVRQAIQIAKLVGTREEVDRFEGGGRLF